MQTNYDWNVWKYLIAKIKTIPFSMTVNKR